MDESKIQYRTIDEYISIFPKAVSSMLQTIRETIQKEAPEAIEAISYQMPTFKLNGRNLVHFAAWKSHIGFYPAPSGIEEFKKELASYNVAKGSIQFSMDKPLPLSLIGRIVKFRVEEILGRKK